MFTYRIEHQREYSDTDLLIHCLLSNDSIPGVVLVNEHIKMKDKVESFYNIDVFRNGSHYFMQCLSWKKKWLDHFQ